MCVCVCVCVFRADVHCVQHTGASDTLPADDDVMSDDEVTLLLQRVLSQANDDDDDECNLSRALQLPSVAEREHDVLDKLRAASNDVIDGKDTRQREEFVLNAQQFLASSSLPLSGYHRNLCVIRVVVNSAIYKQLVSLEAAHLAVPSEFSERMRCIHVTAMGQEFLQQQVDVAWSMINRDRHRQSVRQVHQVCGDVVSQHTGQHVSAKLLLRSVLSLCFTQSISEKGYSSDTSSYTCCGREITTWNKQNITLSTTNRLHTHITQDDSVLLRHLRLAYQITSQILHCGTICLFPVCCCRSKM